MQTFDLGDVVEFDGKFWESQIPNNTNHKPTSLRDSFWKELPSNYSAEREDWEFEAIGVKQRFFYMAPDGQMFESDEEALNYTENLLLNSSNFLYSDRKDLEEDKQSLVREVKYAVTDFAVQGSTSHATTTFDPKTLQYTLSAAQPGDDIIDAPYLKGEVTQYSNNFEAVDGSVFSYEGNYYLVTEKDEFDATTLDDLNLLTRKGGGVFFLGKDLPREGKELIAQGDYSISGKKGDYIYSREFDLVGNPTFQYFVAVEDFTEETSLADNPKFVTLPAYSTRQGAQWSSSSTYDQGQIVLHNGRYFQCQENNFNNKIDLYDAENSQSLVEPDDEFISQVTLDEEGNASEEVQVANDKWLPLGESLDYVLKFKTTHQESPEVSIYPAGTSGRDASAKRLLMLMEMSWG